MAEADQQRTMSIIPYGSSTREVVLRHNDAIVVFDHASRSLVLRNASQDAADVELTDCPYCHRPMRETPTDAARDSSQAPGSTTQPGFVNPGYFRMLDASLPGSPSASGPPSPRRRLVQPAGAEAATTGADYGPVPTSAHNISSDALSPNYFKRFFVEERELGRGGKGVVLLVKHVLDGVSLGHFACKRVPVGNNREWLKNVLTEVQLLQHLSHQNLVSYRHVWLEDAKLSNFGPSVPCAFILQQYCNAGDLHQYICGPRQATSTPQQLKERLRRRSKGQTEPPSSTPGPRKLQFDEIYSFFKDITSGLRFLHSQGFIHRDLKPSNCLLHDTGHELRVLVSDFGEVQYENTVRNSTGTTGTISYCAPEVLQRLSPDGPFGNFTPKSDVFSLGMILYFLCFAQLPYRNADIIDEDREDLDQLRAEISQWAGFDDARRMRPDLPEKLYTFLKRLLSVDPDKRPTAEEVLNGIQAGAPSANNDSRRFHGRNGAAFPDIRSGPRVLPVDTPTSSSSTSWGPRSPNKPVSSGATFPAPVPVLQPTNYPSDSPEHSSEVAQPMERHRSLSRDQDLVLRRPISATRQTTPPHNNHNHTHDHTTIPPRHLLLPPPPRSFFPRINSHLAIANVISFCLLVAKVLSVIQPCSPLAVSPWFLYPLLFLAALDFAANNLWVHVVTFVFHVVTVALAVRGDVLCVWVPDGVATEAGVGGRLGWGWEGLN